MVNCRLRSWSALCLLAAAGWPARPALAQYEPAKLPDPSRRWSVNASLREEYDDNIFTSSDNKIASFKTIFNPQLLVNLPAEQTFVGFRYGYIGTYFQNRPGTQLDNEHTIDLLLSHTFTPRLVLNVNDNFRYAIEPGLVDDQTGQPVEVRRLGNYLYNNLNSDLSYNVSRLWVLTVRGEWDHWDYQTDATNTNIFNTPPTVTTNVTKFSNSYDLYSGTVSANYTVSPRTTAGINYRYEMVDYVDPGTNNIRNSQSHIIYGSMVHRFNPQLNLQLNAGGEYREFGSGNTDIGPFLGTTVTYSYAKDSSVAVGANYALTTADQTSYQSSDTLSIFGRVTHQLTPKLSADFTATFALNNYQNPTSIGVANTVQDESLSLALNAHYQFTHWFSGEAGYAFDWSSASSITAGGFERNRLYLGGRVTY